MNLRCLQPSEARHWLLFIHNSNRPFTSALPDRTLYKVFLGSKLDLSMLHVWDCTAYVLVQRDKRPLESLGPHMKKCVFIGCSGYAFTLQLEKS